MIKKLNLTTAQFNGEVSYILGNSWAIRTGSSKVALISCEDGSYREVGGILPDVSFFIRPHWSDTNKLFYWIADKVYLYDVNTQKSEDYWTTGHPLLPRSVKGDRNDYEINKDGDAIMLLSSGNNTGCRVANLSKKIWLTAKPFSLPTSFDTAQVAPSGDHIQVSYDGKTEAWDFDGTPLMKISNYDDHTDTAIFQYKGKSYNGLFWRQPNSGAKKGALMVTVYDVPSKYTEDIMVWDNPNNLVPACTIGQVSASFRNKLFLSHISGTNEFCTDNRAKQLSILSLNLDEPFYKQVWQHNNIPSSVVATQPEVFIGPMMGNILPLLVRIHENGVNELYLHHVEVPVKAELPVITVEEKYDVLKVEYEKMYSNLNAQVEKYYNQIKDLISENSALDLEIHDLKTIQDDLAFELQNQLSVNSDLLTNITSKDLEISELRSILQQIQTLCSKI